MEMEENQATATSQHPVEGNKQKLLWVVFGVAIAILLGLFCYWYFFQRPQSLVDTANDGVDDSSDDEEITWLTFNDDVTDVSFEYPEGATVTGGVDDEEEICAGTNACFEYVVVYNELEITITGVTGIGGESVSPSEKYMVVSGDKDGGLAREISVSADASEISGRYFIFVEGPLVPVISAWVDFTVASTEADELLRVADHLACSFYDLELNDEYLYGSFYISDSRVIIKVDQSGEEQGLFYAGVSEDDELVDLFIVSPDEKYLAILTRIGNGPDQYFYIYDVDTKAVIEINGENHWEAAYDMPIWINDYQVVAYSDSKYYKYDVTALTRTVLTAAEYDQYIE